MRAIGEKLQKAGFSPLIGLQSWVAYSGLLGMPLWIGAVSASRPAIEPLVGYMASVQLLSSAAAGLACAAFIGRLNLRYIALVAGLLLVFANVFSAFAASAATLFLMRGLSGVAEGVLLATLNATIARTGNADRLFAFSQTSVAVFGILFFAITPRLMETYGVFAPFFFVAVIGALFFLALAFGSGSDAEQATDSSALEGTSSEARWTLAGMLALLGLGLVFVGSQSGWAFMERMGDAKGFSTATIGAGLVAGQFLSLAGPVAAVWVATKLGRLPVAIIGAGLYVAVLTAASMPIAAHFYLVAALCFQFSTLFFVTGCFAWLAARDTGGKAISAAPAAINIGGALGPGFAGWLIHSGGYPTMGAVMIVFFILGGIVIGAAGWVRDEPA